MHYNILGPYTQLNFLKLITVTLARFACQPLPRLGLRPPSHLRQPSFKICQTPAIALINIALFT